MSGVGLLLRRGIAAAGAWFARSGQLDRDDPRRILSGSDVRSGRVFLAGARTMWRARAVIGRTGHRPTELWWRGAPVIYRLDEQAEVSLEFGNGLLLMAGARRSGRAMRLTPLRRELAALDLVLVPARRR